MKIILDNMITYLLSFLLMSINVHIDHHIDGDQDKNSICDINFKENKHNLINHQCQKCLVKNHKLHQLIKIDSPIKHIFLDYYDTKDLIYVKSIISNFQSRSPPNLT